MLLGHMCESDPPEVVHMESKMGAATCLKSPSNIYINSLVYLFSVV